MPYAKPIRAFISALSLALGSAGLHPVAAGEPTSWEKHQSRFRDESVALFQVILDEQKKEQEKEFSSCEIRAEWFDYSVPQSIASTYFGLTIPADLSPSYTPGEPREILDPKGVMQDAFCLAKEDDEKQHLLLESLKQENLRSDKEPEKRPRSPRNRRFEYTVPIFDRHYRRAVVIGSARNSWWWVQPDGPLRSGFDLDIWASIYVKRKGRWKLLKHESVASGHGGT
jgi:hypothetical protein